jgi:hypothetical protein
MQLYDAEKLGEKCRKALKFADALETYANIADKSNDTMMQSVFLGINALTGCIGEISKAYCDTEPDPNEIIAAAKQRLETLDALINSLNAENKKEIGSTQPTKANTTD